MTVCVKIKGVHMYCELVKRKEIIGKTIASPLGRTPVHFQLNSWKSSLCFCAQLGRCFCSIIQDLGGVDEEARPLFGHNHAFWGGWAEKWAHFLNFWQLLCAGLVVRVNLFLFNFQFHYRAKQLHLISFCLFFPSSYCSRNKEWLTLLIWDLFIFLFRWLVSIHKLAALDTIH